MKPKYQDVLTLAHRGASLGQDAIVAYYLENYSAVVANIHLQDALRMADEITAAAAAIRATMATPEAQAEAA